MTANRMTQPLETMYAVTLHHTDDRPSVKLLVARTAVEVEDLMRKGHVLTTEPPLPNTRKSSAFSEAITAVVRLAEHASTTGDRGLRERANQALIALLRGSGISVDDDENGAPSGRQLAPRVPPIRERTHTMPGIGNGGRR